MGRTGVVVVGSHVQGLFMRVDRFPTTDETVLGWDYKEAQDGGKGSHQAIACARLGLPTHFVGRIGSDRLGDTGARWMSVAGVDLTFTYRSEKTATGCGFVMINPQGIPAIATAMGANEELSPEDVDRAAPILRSAELVLVTFEIPVQTALHAVRRAKEFGAFTILTPGPAEPLPSRALAALDLLVPNETEAKVLTGCPSGQTCDPAELASRLQQHLGTQRVVITLGERGAFLAEGSKQETIQAFKVEAVDTPGAGDAFTAGMAYGLMQGESLVEAARFGCLTAARAVTVRESIPAFGTLAEIEEFASLRGISHPLFAARAGERESEG